MGTIFIMVILCGWNPYITNTWNHSSPFYPLHTFDEANHPKEDILRRWYTWDQFREARPWQRFLFTHLIYGNGMIYPDIQSDEDVHIDVQKVRIIQFMFFYSLGLLFFIQKWDHWLVILAIILTVAIHPHSWWGRFVPQMFALPFLILACLQSQVREKSTLFSSRWIAMTTFFLAILLLSNFLDFLRCMRRYGGDVILEAKEIAILDSSPRVYTGWVVREFYLNELEQHFYLRHFFGFQRIWQYRNRTYAGNVLFGKRLFD